MNKRFTIYQQFSNIGLRPGRKTFLLLVLIFSIGLLVFSLIYEPNFGYGNGWGYAGTGIAICLIAGVLFLLQRETRLHQLTENEKQYHTLIQNLPGAIYTCDASGYIKLYNKAAVELWGKKPVAGKDRWSGALKMYNTKGMVLPPDSCPMALTLKEGRAIQGKEIIIQRPNRRLRHVVTYPSPVFNADGNLSGAINIVIDITKK